MVKAQSNASHGKKFQRIVDDKLQALKREGFLTHAIKDFRGREPGYKNPDQYYAPFLIQFNDRTRWILFTTTSLRTDRIKGQQWDADRLKHIDASISKAYLVYPDDVDESVRLEFIRQKEKYDSDWEFSRIDDIIQYKDLLALIKDSEEQNLGRAWDICGRNFERFIAEVLNNQEYLRMWQQKKPSSDFKFCCFRKILECLKVGRDLTVSIRATADKDDIGLLPSGGSPKTDVMADIKFANGTSRIFTFSCKRSTKKQVSAHQYSADSFADVIDKTDVRLRALLRTFQIYGNKAEFPSEDAAALQAMLSDRVNALCKWVVGGFGGEGSGNQLANYVITYRADKELFTVHSTDEYVRLMMTASKGFFGTPFQWTFASGQKGKSIQLKMPML